MEETRENQNALVAHTLEAEVLHPFSSIQSFTEAWRMATVLSQSTVIPANYQGKNNIPNAVVALELANRMGMSPLLVMQNLYVIQGRPSWSAQFLIAMINSSGKFSPLRWKIEKRGKKKFTISKQEIVEIEDCTYTTWAKEMETGDVLEGPEVSTEMAIAEGWYQKNGSKWKSMPDLMFRYRSAAFFSRLYCPDIAMGLKTSDELEDMGEPLEGVNRVNKTAKERAADLTKILDEKADAPAEEVSEATFVSANSAREPETTEAAEVAGTPPNTEEHESAQPTAAPSEPEKKRPVNEPEPAKNEQQKPDPLADQRRILWELLGVFGLGLPEQECEDWVKKRFGGKGVGELDAKQLGAAVMEARKEIDSH